MNSAQLLGLFEKLGRQEQATLLAFAEFLVSRKEIVAGGESEAAEVPAPIPEPGKIERPPGESVVAGLKRLARTYPMLDKSEMLRATSDIVASHVMQGTDPGQVIDQLEVIFAEHYRQLKEQRP